MAQRGQNLFMGHGSVLLKAIYVCQLQALPLVAGDRNVVQLNFMHVLGMDAHLAGASAPHIMRPDRL